MTQEKLNQFYDIDNLARFDIDIPQEVWDKLRTSQPKGNLGYKGPRYDWFKTNSVTVSTRDFPAKKFQNVAIRKRSWAGSKNNVKPSFRLHFTKFEKSNKKEIKALIGTKRLVLQNSIQDDSFIRQPLGYEMLRQAGVPALRCNLATVKINDASPTVYNNIEALKKPLLKNNFSGNKKGNLYKIDLKQDLKDETWSSQAWWGTPTFKGFSKFDNENDIELLGKVISTGDWDTVRRSVDNDAFIKFFAMETLLKHWDGFTQQINNTFTYNDVVVAEAAPAMDDLNFKLIISGIDQILQEDRDVVIGQEAMIARVAVQDSETKRELYACIRDYAEGHVFSDESTHETIDRLAAVLRQASAPDETVTRAIDTMKSQIRQVRDQARVLIHTHSLTG